MTPERVENSAQIPSQYVDRDPLETIEWTESLSAVIDNAGPGRARFLMLELLRQAAARGLDLPRLVTTDYMNSIAPIDEPAYPGDRDIEERLRSYMRWNAAIMVHRAQRPGVGVGGHISTYASTASLYEVGFNHFFRGLDHPGGGDQIFYQGHASPGLYARAFLEGRLSESHLDGFRQELSHTPSISSYPHPRLMPDFWQFPSVSMGLGPMQAIYQARFNKYLHARGIKDTSQQRVWAFLGDGEMDEPESTGVISLAAREGLDNLTFVVNCNLQRLDGPVRGNGKVIQELEGIFRGAGWNVLKVVWGSGWDRLFDADRDGALVQLMNSTVDGDFQTLRTENGAYIREHFFGRDPRTAALVQDISDDEIWALRRGGHDEQKIYAAFDAAVRHTGQPTVILAKTIKGYALGPSFEGRNATHQMKKMSLDDIKTFRDRLEIPLADSQLDKYLPSYFHPGEDSPEAQYLLERRRSLGGFMPSRKGARKPLPLPADSTFDAGLRGSGHQEVATTMAFVRLFKDLMKDAGIGNRFVPIIPDEARTFGMDSLFPVQKVYSPKGQTYTGVDRELMLQWKENTAGQILHEGINEAGSTSSFIAAGSSYSTHGEPMIPVYIFYSMFGFQRTGDSFWAAMDQLCNGFVLGATAGRTTLNGEGLQHQDGHSHLLASTNPAVVAYDPAYAYELTHIIKDGLRRMYGENAEDIFYYITMYNEPYAQPAQPDDVDVEGILKGIYKLRNGEGEGTRVQLLASGVAVPWALKAQQLLRDEWDVVADVWSVTSWNELRRDGLDADRANLLDPTTRRTPYVTAALAGAPGPVIGVSDYMNAVQDQIRPYVSQHYATLGTDGWGMADTRGALRRHFLVDAESIVVKTLLTLEQQGAYREGAAAQAAAKYDIGNPAAADAGSTEGSG